MFRKQVPWTGWKKLQPSSHQRTHMFHKCGKKCFLGKNKSFPICKKNTCKICKKGLYAAYVRAREYSSRSPKYSRIANKAKKMLTKKNIKKN
jgi:hydroxylamine reductase (hybrid-cluster protein)